MQKRLFEGANVILPRIYDRKGSQREEVKVSILGLRHSRSSLSSQHACNNEVPVTTLEHLQQRDMVTFCQTFLGLDEAVSPLHSN